MSVTTPNEGKNNCLVSGGRLTPLMENSSGDLMRRGRMKVVGFLGSSKKKGNTSRLIRQLLNGCAEKGARTKVYNLNKLNIKGCLGCGHCKQSPDHLCFIQDDMQKLYEAIDDADAIVIGSPIYMWQTTPQTKVFLDRLYAFLNIPGYTSKLDHKKDTVLIYTQRDNYVEKFKYYFDQTKTSLNSFGFNVKEVVIVDTKEEMDLAQHPTVMKKVKSIGKGLITNKMLS